MNKDEAIKFLKNHQPMPNDDILSEDLINDYDIIRKYFIKNPDEDCIPLFLNSFGEISGHGVYQLVEDVVTKYDKSKVLPHLIKSLESKYRGIRYWNAQIAAEFPDEKLVVPLKKLMSENDSDIKMSSIRALVQIAFEKINYSEILDLLNKKLFDETDNDVIELLKEAIIDLES